MRRLLCVIDLTASSVDVLKVAVSVAIRKNAQLTVLYPYRLVEFGYKGDLFELRTKLEQSAQEKFLTLKIECAGLHQIPYEFLLEIGFTADRINSFITNNKTDGVVISQLQANSMNESDARALQELIANSQIPFTIVPEFSKIS